LGHPVYKVIEVLPKRNIIKRDKQGCRCSPEESEGAVLAVKKL